MMKTQVEVITSVQRRRSWSRSEKVSSDIQAHLLRLVFRHAKPLSPERRCHSKGLIFDREAKEIKSVKINTHDAPPAKRVGTPLVLEAMPD
jgi:hypothetical protein